eukprot:6398231-Ditylum_brightwellii.AAC.1
MTKKDAKLYARGSYKVAVCSKEGIQLIGWLDGNPVHMKSSADGTGTTVVNRQVGGTKIVVRAPKVVKSYNWAMQA